MDVGVIGLGAMGQAMVCRLLDAGHAVRVWNRSGGAPPGAQVVEDAGDVFKSDVVLTMLSDDAALQTVLLDSGALAQARPGTVHVVMSTISVDFAEALQAPHHAAGIEYVGAPVLGRPDVAARGELNILAAGHGATLDRLAPVFDVLGKRCWRLSDKPSAAFAAKIACNMMITMAIEAMAEAVVLTEPYGLAREDFFELILNTLFGSRSYQVYSTQILAGRYQPGFKASLGLKDLGLAQQAAAGLGRDLPMLEAVHGQMRAAVEAGGGSRDWSVMAAHTLGELDAG
ncbi:beta-hydroxyacid dehydrogenase, 3-hydroxyisobutyrate dehydrogenase [Frateuria aurantia DSM 6220]|uniref:Beta-hydroxyacid dehydrogenase, 3-hydroxyisobutyrate dehydrogenase n=1 Tax=Frateuria aurantia (strain ATCC 33424 / DSM 6220 / KCTC 2777 / LMG 1558 / NBRC 3245 / NCIMB 13370) TaxID=767434 RepID=H8L371_FRAAD|nr:beta-hydroxyacid dehydrogenase, 3-hydroxyisobutyrate dehydrogenase [Frateuria aurantia DSM 6220]